MASRSENEHATSNASVEHYSTANAQYLDAGKRILGRLPLEQTVYEARVTHDRSGDGRRASMDSGNSQRMIIKKGFERSVDYDTRNTSAVEKEEESPYVVADDVRSER